MSDSIPLEALVAAAAVGTALHVLVLRRGEWHLHSITLVTSFLAAQFALVAYLSLTRAHADSGVLVWRPVAQITAWFLAGLVASTVAYRTLFHRLSQFPGPFMARVSSLYVEILGAKRLHLHEEFQEMHKKYGDFVRIGKPILT